MRGWLERGIVHVPRPGDRHVQLLGTLLEGTHTGNHVADAHLAALAVEWGLELVSADHDSPATRACAGPIPWPRGETGPAACPGAIREGRRPGRG